MSETQFYVSVAVMPTVTIIVVLIGVLLNNTNLNAQLSDVNSRFDDLRNEMSARLGELRAEIAKNHSEMLTKFAELDGRLSRLEAGSS